MAGRLKVGVVGVGGIFCGAHAPAWQANKDVEIVALCDIVPEKAERFAKAHGIKQVFKDYHDLLALKELDAVDICTPNLFHSQVAVAALQARKHVFTEKPDAINAHEAQKMADAAQESGKILMAMRNNRFEPSVQFLRKFIDGGHMGEIYTGRCGWVRRRGIPGKGGWFTTKALSGGGPLIDLGVHFLDVAIWLMGNPRPASVSAATYRKFAEGTGPADSVHANFGEAQAGGIFDVEDLAAGFVRFAGGASLQLEFSWASNIDEEATFVELRGTKAGIKLHNYKVTVFTEMEGSLVDLTPRLGPLGGSTGHGRHLNHFVDCVLGRATPINTPEQGLDIMKILSAIYESAQSGAEVRL